MPMPYLTIVHVQSESKINILDQNQVYIKDLLSLNPKISNQGNNQVSRRFGRSSFKYFWYRILK